MRAWACVLALLLGILGLFAFPVRIVIGALIIWYLMKEDVRQAFDVVGDASLAEAAPPDDGDEPA